MLMVPITTIQSPAAFEREMTFPGFNGRALNGCVRKGSEHPFFAVWVAGSGPTDRNGSTPLIRDPRTGKPIPSHAYRDLAEWLAHRGIGSLRWDKRFIGSRDPALDVSLDAQLGDLKAALAFARTLPEAHGKRLLLLGHGEGALLSLMVASEADALLLLSPPSQSMAKAIETQVEAQIPPDRIPVHRAYLRDVLQVLRSGQSLPAPHPDVHPALVTLAQGLARPETRTFVQATLDVDPWALAARVAVPLAMVWGDKDVQMPAPTNPPSNHPGVRIILANANHLLKHEPRSRSELTPAQALTAYGDDTPLADLGPLEAWLQALRQGVPSPP